MTERITIEGRQVSLASGNTSGDVYSISIEQFIEGLIESMVRGLTPEPVPGNVRWLVQRQNLTLCIVELTPEVRWIKWLADNSPVPFGPEALYAEHRLATPYVVLKVPFWGQRIVPRIEVFYRNQPLESLDGDGAHSLLAQPVQRQRECLRVHRLVLQPIPR